MCSMLYSGTGALKTDFTRTGKRTKAGALEDGKRAIKRYVLNNFMDTYNQNSLDFILGKVSWEQLSDDFSINGKNVIPTVLIVFFFNLVCFNSFSLGNLEQIFRKGNWNSSVHFNSGIEFLYGL